MNQPPVSSATPETPGSGGAVFLAWAFVGIPLLWGVSQTFIKALDLFK
ncbi:MFS transporter small subunit [Hymenobacter psychrophilus]|uniref:Oxalate:formate antiporter n=1 Tax=Hymenobacter psychrophilus TaxID=651662 RepID=A0A1H3I0H7_9BACT|nr:hypothetical protein [Hymenobacter psychrophilus]SDY21226.1 hypothetical protein SAMN04488069_106232 [Hymenobacter psychrophilus]